MDLAYPALPEEERAALLETLQAAAVPHWCDEALLAALQEIPVQDAAQRLARLARLPVMERFPARGATALNVHEASRLALRPHLAETSAERFRLLSTRAARFFANDIRPAGRIEWIFHRLSADPEREAAELGQLNRSWSGTVKPEDQYALAAALQELDGAQRIHGRARGWALLVIAWARTLKGETARLGEAARTALQFARTAKDLSAEGDAQCLLGDVLQAQGQPAATQEAFGQSLAIFRRLAEQDPSNAGWQRGLAVAVWWLASCEARGGRGSAALSLYEEGARILTDLVEKLPDRPQFRDDLESITAEMDAVRGQIASE